MVIFFKHEDELLCSLIQHTEYCSCCPSFYHALLVCITIHLYRSSGVEHMVRASLRLVEVAAYSDCRASSASLSAPPREIPRCGPSFVFSKRELMFMFAINRRPSVSSVVCNARAPYSGDWNFRQCFYAIWYIRHLWPFGKNFTEIVPGEPLRRGRGLNQRGVEKCNDFGAFQGSRKGCKI